MSAFGTGRSGRDKAYACFIVPILFVVLTVVLSRIPMGTGWAGGVGLLVLVPLALFSLVTLPTGLYLAMKNRADRALLTLAVITLVMVVFLFLEILPGSLRHGACAVMGLLAMALELHWFAYLRWREDMD